MQLVDVGESLTVRDMDEILWGATYPSRGKVAELLVQKFASEFSESVSLDGNNTIYFEVLREYLKGKKYADQYSIIVEQIDKMDLDSDVHGAAPALDIDLWWIRSYLKDIVK